MVTELSVTPSLAELVQLCPLAPNEVVSFLRNLAAALDAAHSRGGAHLSLSPDNVFVGAPPRFEVRIADLGARWLLGVAGIDVQWAAPELTARPHMACDVFTAALLTLFAATGVMLQGRSEAVLRTPATSLARETGSLVDPRWEEPLARALCIDPAQRYGKVSELAAAVAQAFGVPPAEPSIPLMPRLASAPSLPAFAAVAPSSEMDFATPQPDPTFVASPHPEPSPGVPEQRKGIRRVMLGAGIALALGAIGLVGWTVSRRGEGRVPVTSVASSGSHAGLVPTGAVAFDTPPPAMGSASTTTAARAGDARRPAQLTVACTPECEVVTVDGKAVASFPITVAPGSHTATARRGRHPAQTKHFEMTAGEDQTVSFVFFAPRPTPAPKKPCGKFLQRCD
jgi:hypothetical protein